MSRGQFSSTSTNVVIPTIPPQYSKGLRENYMRHLWETMSGSGNSGTGAEPTPCHIHTHPTTNHTLHTQQAPRPRPRLFCPHSPICTQLTGTSRCPAPTRRPGLASAPLMRSKRRPPRPKHSKFTQFHRSGLHFGRTPYNWKHVEGDTMDAHTIYTIAAHAHSTTGANNAERRRLARRAQLGELVRIAPGYYLDTEVSPRIPSHPSSSHLHGCSPCSTSIPTSSCPARPPHGSGACHFCTSTHSTSPRFPTSTRAQSHFRRFTRVHSISRRSRCAHTGREEDDHRR